MTQKNDARRDIRISFEFFPPKSEEMEGQLWSTVRDLQDWNPEFVSVTYGAGGTTKAPTLSTVTRFLTDTPLATASHLTCVSATKEETHQVVDSFRKAGVTQFGARASLQRSHHPLVMERSWTATRETGTRWLQRSHHPLVMERPRGEKGKRGRVSVSLQRSHHPLVMERRRRSDGDRGRHAASTEPSPVGDGEFLRGFVRRALELLVGFNGAITRW